MSARIWRVVRAIARVVVKEATKPSPNGAGTGVPRIEASEIGGVTRGIAGGEGRRGQGYLPLASPYALNQVVVHLERRTKSR